MLPGAGQLRKEMKTLSGYLTLLRELNEKDLEEQERNYSSCPTLSREV